MLKFSRFFLMFILLFLISNSVFANSTKSSPPQTPKILSPKKDSGNNGNYYTCEGWKGFRRSTKDGTISSVVDVLRMKKTFAFMPDEKHAKLELAAEMALALNLRYEESSYISASPIGYTKSNEIICWKTFSQTTPQNELDKFPRATVPSPLPVAFWNKFPSNKIPSGGLECTQEIKFRIQYLNGDFGPEKKVSKTFYSLGDHVGWAQKEASRLIREYVQTFELGSDGVNFRQIDLPLAECH